MKKQLGTTRKNEPIYISSKAINPHLFATGQSGSGKSTALLSLAVQCAEAGERIVVFNWRQTLNRKVLLPALKERYIKLTKVVNVAADGIALPLFDALTDPQGYTESRESVIERVTSLLEVSCNLTEPQAAQTYFAVKDIMNNNYYTRHGMSAIFDWLSIQEKAVANNAAAKLRKMCNGNIFHDGDILSCSQPIIEFDLNGLELREQKKIVKFLLEYFLHIANKGQFIKKRLTLWLDEAQNLEWSEDSTLHSLINEARRLNLAIWMALPSIRSTRKNDMEVIMQCGTKLFFSPLAKERREVAETISPKDADALVFTLFGLEKFECVASGSFLIGDTEFSGHKVVCPVYKEVRK